MRLKRYLTERRSHPELNPKIEDIDLLKKYLNQPGYVFSLTELLKIGTNPHYDFDTPLGVYFYILNDDNLQELKSGSLFATDRPYIHIAKVNMSKVLNIQTYNINNFTKDYNTLSKLYKDKINRIGNKGNENEWIWAQIVANSNLGLAVGKTPEEQIKNLIIKSPGRAIFYLTHNIAKKLSYLQSSTWERILRVDLGYQGVWDDGSGTIHPSEKSQFVAFNPNVYNVVDMISNTINYTHTLKLYDEKNKRQAYISSMDGMLDLFNKVKNIDVIQRLIEFIPPLLKKSDKFPKTTGITIDKESFMKSITYNNMKRFVSGHWSDHITFTDVYDFIKLCIGVLSDTQITDIMRTFLNDTMKNRDYKNLTDFEHFVIMQKKNIVPEELKKYFDIVMDEWRKEIKKREGKDIA
jgi:hypothetical protein